MEYPYLLGGRNAFKDGRALHQQQRRCLKVVGTLELCLRSTFFGKYRTELSLLPVPSFVTILRAWEVGLDLLMLSFPTDGFIPIFPGVSSLNQTICRAQILCRIWSAQKDR
jgi:hypothetical protein